MMWEKINNFLNIIIGSSIGVFIGHGIFVYWDYKTHLDLYAMQPSPWYTSILTYGIFTMAILIMGMMIKLFIKRKQNE